MPAFGPSSDVILEAAVLDESPASPSTNFRLVNISSSTLPTAAVDKQQLFPPGLLQQKFLTSNQQVIPGDVIGIRVWEAADDGLFATSKQRETDFTLTVSNSGTIDVPYAGNISVTGKSVHEIRGILLNRYRGKAIDPEINVDIKETTSRGVSVLGAIAIPGRINVPAQGIRLLDLLALAGGTPHPDWEVTVRITRQDSSASLGLDQVLDKPENNIIVLPNDSLQIIHLPRRFAVYGAITNPGNISINAPNPRLSDLLAESGGLKDMQAEASSVFVFRPTTIPAATGQDISTAYRLNFEQPDAFILASQFEISSSDIVYVATAGASEFRKFVTTLLSPFLGSAGGVQNLGD
ncbi:MAG: polysaccharide biosynthesis/export family protein [Candidatus Thiodiazotropha sp.]|jgi:polysaccharide export outer membrane protein